MCHMLLADKEKLMRLHDLLIDLPDARVSGPTDIEIRSIAYDSRAVRPGSLFIAIRGFHTDGWDFIPQALERGAVAVVVETLERSNVRTFDLSAAITWVEVTNPRTALAPIAAAFYGYPGAAVRVVGITGTERARHRHDRHGRFQSRRAAMGQRHAPEHP
jgi:UDP-N-acetylmuramoyl-L-alanyl-D-glutamate--2,6-diaminopimelate ligase